MTDETVNAVGKVNANGAAGRSVPVPPKQKRKRAGKLTAAQKAERQREHTRKYQARIKAEAAARGMKVDDYKDLLRAEREKNGGKKPGRPFGKRKATRAARATRTARTAPAVVTAPVETALAVRAAPVARTRVTTNPRTEAARVYYGIVPLEDFLAYLDTIDRLNRLAK